MTQYIDKAAVVAEIERRIAFFSDINNKQVVESNLDCAIAFAGLRDFLNTIEAKEVDLEKELSYEDYIGFFKEHPNFPDDWGFDEAWVFAKHFFGLGIKAQKG